MNPTDSFRDILDLQITTPYEKDPAGYERMLVENRAEFERLAATWPRIRGSIQPLDVDLRGLAERRAADNGITFEPDENKKPLGRTVGYVAALPDPDSVRTAAEQLADFMIGKIGPGTVLEIGGAVHAVDGDDGGGTWGTRVLKTENGNLPHVILRAIWVAKPD